MMITAGAAPSSKPKICFVSPYNYPLFNSQVSGNFGGWEVQIYHIASELARRGHFRVSLIVGDFGQPERETRQGVELLAWKGKSFWGISPADAWPADGEPPAPEQPSARPGPSARSGWWALGRRVYKRLVHWRLRVALHGLTAGTQAGLQLAFYKARPILKAALRGKTMVGDMPILPDDIRVFDAAGADLYIAPGVSDISAFTAWYCRTHAKRYIMLAGSDRDFNPKILEDPDGRDTYSISHSLLLYTIRNASCHIVQNENQARLARAFGVSPVMVPNPMDLTTAFLRSGNPQTILWVGNTEDPVKQPRLMLRLIGSLPQFSFVMIVTPVDPAAFVRLQAAAGRLPNVTFLGRVPYDRVERYYADARLLVNTSAFEGLPNTFLQAGKYGAPVISLNVDPNGMLSRNGCGLVCNGDPGLLAENIRRVMTDPALYERMSANIQQYVAEVHNPQAVIPQYEAAFQAALERQAGPGSAPD